jgi:hypothetical protein
VYLYSEITQKFDGRIETFLALKGRVRPQNPDAAPTNSLRLACIDIGGGTTDLMVTTYWSEANRLLQPAQTFREGFRIAGDDLVQRVISTIVLPRLQESIESAGGSYVGEKMRELFGADIGGQDQQIIQKRRQFGLRVLVPIAVSILEFCETVEEFERFDLHAADLFGRRSEELAEGNTTDADADVDAPIELQIPSELPEYVEHAAQSLGAADWKLADLTISVARDDVDAIAREVFQKVLGNMCEMIDHLGADIVLLTGRPSRLPAVRSIVEELMVVSPHRLVSMHSFKTGSWYPFRDPVSQRIGDPKSTVSVGGMLIALSENKITNFKVDTAAYLMNSTVRFVGEMDTSGQILNERLLFSNLDLDQKTGSGEQIATVDMYAPMHIGSRQLPLERWATTPMFRLDYSNSAAQRLPVPIRVTFEKADFEEADESDSSETVLRREALREAFTITEVEDGDGDMMKPTDISLRLHTLGFEDEYWLDTGVFRLG